MDRVQPVAEFRIISASSDAAQAGVKAEISLYRLIVRIACLFYELRADRSILSSGAAAPFFRVAVDRRLLPAYPVVMIGDGIEADGAGRRQQA